MNYNNLTFLLLKIFLLFLKVFLIKPGGFTSCGHRGGYGIGNGYVHFQFF